jgi:glyoxylase-like metal-dependent hydrolase (beta-lactamase superfamily II)/rhodanese-related sulfurtransferase
VIFRQFVDDDLGCASYLVGDESAGVAVVVDPAYRIEQYLEEAEGHAVKIVRVLETHTHADHVSGHGRLALEHGIPVSIHPAAEVVYAHDPLSDGDELELGAVKLRVLHTPGHRPEHCAFAVIDTSRAQEPWLVLTGDSLFVGDAARPDLAVEARDGAADLFNSLQRLARLADGVELYPGHVAGSLCGAGMSSKASSTIGFERSYNHALGIPELDRFVTEVAASLPPRPPNMDAVVELNRGPFVGAAAPLGRLDAAPDGAVVLDVRSADEFAAGHVPGALNVPVDGSSFATKSGFVLPPGNPVVVHGSQPEVDRAANGLRSVGFLELAGFLLEVATPERMASVDLGDLERLLADDSIELVDVREADERDRGYIPGSRHIPYRLARQAAENGLAGGKPVVTICETGARAAVAASVLAAAGVDARPVLHGGVAEWRARGGETVPFRRCGT